MFRRIVVDGQYRRIYSANIQKSIRIDKQTFDIINSMPGRSFSEKLMYLVLAYDVLSKK